jgi:hypothetical protein
LEAAQIWRELAPHYFPADCFEKKHRSQNNPPKNIVVPVPAKIWGELAPYYFKADCFEKKNQSQNNPPENNVVPVPAKIWWIITFFGGSKNIAGQTTVPFFSGRNFFGS